MACATLKRSLDWDPMLGQPAKRRRCIPFCTSPSHKDRPGGSSPSSSGCTTPKAKSVFPDVISQKMTPEKMAASIRAELKRLQRRKQLVSSMEHSDGSSSGSENDSPRSEKALFTFRQVGLICERMLREKECEIREEYDNVLTAKLAEQYDAFVKFTYDQIQRNFQATPSYLS